MKVYILKKSITDLKNPIIKKEFETNSKTVQDLIIEMVAAKLGVALLPKKICEKIKDEPIVAVPFDEQHLFLELGMTWKKNKYLPYAVREFIELGHQFISS